MDSSAQRPSQRSFSQCLEDVLRGEDVIRAGGGERGVARQRKLDRLPVRERIEKLLDDTESWMELGIWAGWEMYPEWGNIASAGVVSGVGKVSGQDVMVIANDATVKAGAMFPQSIKKLLRAQRVAMENSLPTLYLVDSSGVFLPMQDEVFPDEDDFGRIFRNNAVMSAQGIPQYAAIMGNCVAGGAYLPVLCDKIIMTEGSGLYLAAPSLVKAAIGQEVDAETLGGATMHSRVSGTVDFHEPDDEHALERLRSLVALLPSGPLSGAIGVPHAAEQTPSEIVADKHEYDMLDLIEVVVDKESLQESKPSYGTSLVTCYARIGGVAVGIVANQKMRTQSVNHGIQIGGVIYGESADKAARFVMDCNQMELPLIFIQDVTGFMVGKEAEASGIIRSGAKLVNAMSNATVPKITLIVGGSFGAGNYALCGKAYDPRFIVAWPNAQFSVMGAEQASNTLFQVLSRARMKEGNVDEADLEQLRDEIRAKYEEHMDIRYGAARGWVDRIIQPDSTRCELKAMLKIVTRHPVGAKFNTGVMQV